MFRVLTPTHDQTFLLTDRLRLLSVRGLPVPAWCGSLSRALTFRMVASDLSTD